MRSFDIGPNKTRIGALLFSNDVHTQFTLDTYSDKDTLISAIQKMPYIGGGTNTNVALKFLREDILSSAKRRSGVPAVAIILTDGMSYRSDVTAMQAQLARDSGIQIFVIGIGNQVDTTELNAIASDPDKQFVFSVDNFEALDQIKEDLAIKTCTGMKSS